MTFSSFFVSHQYIPPKGRVKRGFENTFVKLPFLGTALPELLVVVVETFPVGAEFVEAALVYIFDPAGKV
jgi:hypothetical protein